MRFVLAGRNLANSKKIQNIVARDVQLVRILYMCIQRGLRVACSDFWAMREPLSAEQQQCSPAFFMRVCEREKYTNV